MVVYDAASFYDDNGDFIDRQYFFDGFYDGANEWHQITVQYSKWKRAFMWRCVCGDRDEFDSIEGAYIDALGHEAEVAGFTEPITEPDTPAGWEYVAEYAPPSQRTWRDRFFGLLR